MVFVKDASFCLFVLVINFMLEIFLQSHRLLIKCFGIKCFQIFWVKLFGGSERRVAEFTVNRHFLRYFSEHFSLDIVIKHFCLSVFAEQAIITWNAFVNISEIVSFCFVQDRVHYAFWGLLTDVLEFNMVLGVRATIVQIINESVEVLAFVNYIQLSHLNILSDFLQLRSRISLSRVKDWLPWKGDWDSQFLPWVFDKLFASSR